MYHVVPLLRRRFCSLVFLRFSCHGITHLAHRIVAQVIERRGTPTEEVWKDVSALPNFLEFTPHPKVPTDERPVQVSHEKAAALSCHHGIISHHDPLIRPCFCAHNIETIDCLVRLLF